MADDGRRRFLVWMSRVTMAAGLAGGYGGLALIAGRYLYPARPPAVVRRFVAQADSLQVGDALVYEAPSGETINVARHGPRTTAHDFVALSDTCPHLGCRVHWEARNKRYFCPCHNGVFDPSGTGIGGPPGEAGQSLSRYPLEVRDGLLFIAVPAAPAVLARRNP